MLSGSPEASTRAARPASCVLVGELDRQAAALAQGRVIRGRVRDLVLLLRDVVPAVLVQLEGQGGHPGIRDGARLLRRSDLQRHQPDPCNSAPYAYFPFGGGPRSCIGTHFAMTEMLAALAVLVPAVRLRHASDAPVRPELLVTLRPADGLPMRVALCE